MSQGRNLTVHFNDSRGSMLALKIILQKQTIHKSTDIQTAQEINFYGHTLQVTKSSFLRKGITLVLLYATYQTLEDIYTWLNMKSQCSKVLNQYIYTSYHMIDEKREPN